MKKLNGWQRLWVFISVLYVFSILFIGYFTKGSIRDNELISNDDIKYVMNRIEEKQFTNNMEVLISMNQNMTENYPVRKDNGYEFLEVGNANIYLKINNKNFKNFLYSIHRKTDGDLSYRFPSRRFSVVNNKDFLIGLKKYYKNELKVEYNKSEKVHIIGTLLFALIPPLVLYIFGLGVAWVISGFRK
ncbi:MAG: hypothetical protein HRT90_06265 [Candidatus Margulisbacteria bacterium]|nr:hypothetical protein [Candidatus Margulisiibacteriota bacterium]